MADPVGWLQEHWMHLTGTGVAGAGGLAFLMRDSLKEWWADRHAEKRAELDAKRAQQGFGDKLANELLVILREDLKRNGELLKELTPILAEVRDTLRVNNTQMSEILVLARDTRESQKWIERLYGKGGTAQ